MSDAGETGSPNPDDKTAQATGGATNPPTAPPSPDANDPQVAASLKRYWRMNVMYMTVLLVIWAVAGLGCGVLFADTLNQYSLGGYPLGFWFAQQGSIITFVLIILIYAMLMNRLDKKHHDELKQLGYTGSNSSAASADSDTSAAKGGDA